MADKMPTFTELSKMARRSPDESQFKVAVAGDCATQHIAAAIKGYGAFALTPCEVFDADYDQIRAQITDPSSELYTFAPDYLVVINSTEKLWEGYCADGDRDTFAERKAEEISSLWDVFSANSPSSKLIQFNFPEIDDRVFGNYSGKVPSSFIFQTRKLNLLIGERASRAKSVFILDAASIQNRVGRENFASDKLYYIAKMPISLDVLPAVAKEIFDVILATRGKIKKCVVLDLDNTLWGGVIGDDGLSGIQIGDLGLGHAFSDFQSWLKELKKRGVLLAVCSKNNEETAREPFEKHPDFVLRMEDFSIFVANWEDKATNIRYIRDVLNLGMDSFVFIDDNPFERDLVRSMIPEITVPDLPDDPSQYLSYLRSLNLFETASFSEADAVRTEQYREEVGRAKAQTQFESFDDYLKSLEMKASFAPFDDFHIPRIAQLTQRSNQFNLRTVRYTENQVAAAASDGGRLTLYFTLRDKFGDYGLISVVIMDKTDEETLFIDTWLMSCRVLKRGMEEFIVNKIVEVARENGFSRVIGEYLPTPKNAMVRDIYSRLGFSDEGGGRFVCDVGSFVPNKTYIVS